MTSRSRHARVAAMVVALLTSSPGASAAPANTLDELHAAFAACARIASPDPVWPGSVLTVRFSLHADGHLKGPPRVTYRKLIGSDEQKKAFEAAAHEALSRCFPLDVTDGFGVVLAGRIMIVTVNGTGPGALFMPRN